ncbi:DNA helicase HerA, contains HAS-barrel and ATPase domains [Seinonella peptonophila]|uniref:DNA helicase HerA, contains HAS-barrel and ATPase domains n=1 Tax=Seinonella peptonophila TaxID=112248 RepID=A0A1M4WB94_9BACL|nr:ATP-binding protein [Seinonella peptonophila]SHE78430.1 DNA helicase HerA, contains HAS-barrel and ATPase domains [Seinonella peptonophila]
MANGGKNAGNLRTLFILLILVGLASLWFYHKELFILVSSLSIASIIATLLFVVLPIAILLSLPWISRIYQYFQRSKQLETVRLVISKVDEQNRIDMINFFDFLNGVLLPAFSVQYYYQGSNYFSWEIKSMQGQKEIYISATGDLLSTILRNLQSIYPHVRFEKVEQAKEPVPKEFMQLQLERKWFKSLETVELDSDFGAIKYDKSLTDSLLAAMDEVDGNAGVQFVVAPYSLNKQKRNRLKYRLAKVGGALFECEVRVYADNNQILKGLIGTIGEVNTNNSIVPESIMRYELRKYFQQYWWNFLVSNKMPSLFFGPKMTFASYHLATLMQLPSPRLRVGGMKRFTNRRLPVPAGIPVNDGAEFPLLETEDGVKVTLTEEMFGRHLLVLGGGASGKTMTLTSHMISYISNRDQPSIIISSNPNEAKDFLSLVPSDRKVYIIDMDTPGEWGVNFMSNDETPADIMAENLVGIFQAVFGSKIKNMDFIGQAYLALRAARELSPAWKEAVPAIDLRHIKEVLANEKYRLRLIQALPPDSTLRRYWIERTQLIRNPRYFVTYIAPILTVFGRILSTERLTKTLCHPNTIDLKRILYEEKAVVLMHGGKWDFGFDMNAFSSSMFLAHVYHTLLEQFYIPLPKERLMTNLFLDDFAGFTGRMMMMLCTRGRRIGVRIAASSNTIEDINGSVQNFLDSIIGNKIIFRSYTPDDAKRWSGLMDRLEYDDFMHLTPYHAAVWFMINNERQEPFIAKPILYDHEMKYRDMHPWPEENRNLKLHDIVMPQVGKGEQAI